MTQGPSQKNGALTLNRSLTADLFLFVASVIAMLMFAWYGAREGAHWLWDADQASLISGLCGIMALIAGYRLIRPKPRLIITSEGLLDRTGPGGDLFIRWDEMKSIWPAGFGRIGIQLTDPESVERRAPPYRWMMMRVQRLFGKGSVEIHGYMVRGGTDEVLRMLEEQLGPSKLEPVYRSSLSAGSEQ